MPLTSQAVLGLTSAGYGRSGHASDGRPVARPDLHGTLAQQLRFLMEIERTV